MSNVLTTTEMMTTEVEETEPNGADWETICPVSRLEPERGVAAILDDQPIAVFRIDQDGESRFYAVDHIDPKTQTPTMARGIVGSTQGSPTIAAPLLKEKYSLTTGECLTEPDLALTTFAVRVRNGDLQVRRNVILGKQS